jgi:hypothetical protein
MKRFKKLLLAAVAAVALIAPVAVMPTAQADPPHQNQQHQRIYWVYYRTSASGQWVCYGGYYDANQAQQAVNYFQYYGYDSYYRGS